MRRILALVLTAAVAAWAGPAFADNAMGYSMLTPEEAAGLPHNHGALGLDIERAKVITDSGMTFDIIRVKQARPGSAGARAGLKAGDQIIAIDGRVFPSLAMFAAYVGSLAPGQQASVDYIPSGGGPGQAQRIAIAIGTPAQQAAAPPPAAGGLSTGTKVAIGVGAAALLGCYEMGCFSHRPTAQPQQAGQPVR